MSTTKSRVLVFNWEPDALTNLRRILESDVEATITWGNAVARQLVNTRQFHVILAGKGRDPELARSSTSRSESASESALNQPTLRRVA